MLALIRPACVRACVNCNMLALVRLPVGLSVEAFAYDASSFVATLYAIHLLSEICREWNEQWNGIIVVVVVVLLLVS